MNKVIDWDKSSSTVKILFVTCSIAAVAFLAGLAVLTLGILHSVPYQEWLGGGLVASATAWYLYLRSFK